MIKFLRKIRQHSVMKNQTAKYLKYAIGEIGLVVIGILIALQINNWNEHRKENQLEKRYLKNLVSELKKDSIALHKTHLQLVYQSETKNPVIEMLEKQEKHDSLMTYFSVQWRPIYPYTPLKSTFEEIKSSSHLNIIKSDDVREGIIKMYNSYESLLSDEQFLLEYFKNLVDLLARSIPDIYKPKIEHVLAIGNHPYVINSIRLNGAYTRRSNYEKTLKQCTNLLEQIHIYQANLK